MAKRLTDDPGFWLCAIIAVVFPPVLVAAIIATWWEARQDKKDRDARIAKCAGHHAFHRDPTWDIYPDLRTHEFLCRDCGTPQP